MRLTVHFYMNRVNTLGKCTRTAEAGSRRGESRGAPMKKPSPHKERRQGLSFPEKRSSLLNPLAIAARALPMGALVNARPYLRHRCVTVNARPNDRRKLKQDTPLPAVQRTGKRGKLPQVLEKCIGLKSTHRLKFTYSSPLTSDKVAFPFGLPLQNE